MKFKNFKIFHVYIIKIYVESEKICYIVCKKQNITSDFVAVCYKCIKYLIFWKLVERTVEKKVWFSNLVLSVSKVKKLSLFK